MATGTFDLLHMGHIYFLREAKKLGDELVVVVACDNTVRALKHEPVNPDHLRVDIIKELKMVDIAVIGKEYDMYEIVSDLNPDIIALGYDQLPNEKTLRDELRKRHLQHIHIIRLPKMDSITDLDGTRRIIAKIISAYEFQKKMENVEKT
ncbi:MAG: adenylyltransferase/cytidyltransferase family protein [Thermoplasmatota archaeon]